jgi:DNA-binding PadR family transcriptional regulator
MGVRLRKTPAFLAVVELLLHADRPYGLEIIERTGLPSGTVYPLLARLEREGWVTSHWETTAESTRGPRKRIYEITVTGAEWAVAALAVPREASRGTRAGYRARHPRGLACQAACRFSWRWPQAVSSS